MNRWLAFFAGAWRAVSRQHLIALMNLAALPALALALWGWLYLPDSSVLWVAASSLVLLAALLVLLLLVQYTFLSYYRAHHPMPIQASVNIHPREKPLWRRALSGMPLLLVWFLVYGALCGSISLLQRNTLEWAKPVASWITMFSQRPVSFFTVNAWMDGLLDLLQWVGLPLLFLAVFAGMAGAATWGGNRRRWLRHSLGLLRLPLFWLLWLLFLAAGFWLPSRLITWTPELAGIPAATASLLLRFGLAFLLLFGAWLLLLSSVARMLQFPKQAVIVIRRTPPDPA